MPGGTPDCGPQARAFAYGALTLCRAPSHASSAGHVLCDCGRAVRGPDAASSTPGRQRPHALRAPRFGLAPVRSPLLGGSLLDFLSSGYLDVSVPPVASHIVGSRPSPAGFPHSGTPGSKPVCGSPGTIAACRALRRLPAPRHPPCALHTFGTLGPSGFRSNSFSREISSSSRYAALRVPTHDSCEPRGPDAAGAGGLTSIRDSRLRLPSCLPRKEVIQPHLPVRLPCYDFTPLAPHTFGASPLAVGPATSGADDSGGVTGGVYKARERIHRGVLIRDY